MGFTELALNYKLLHLKLRVFLSSYIVVMVTYYTMKVTKCCLIMIGHLYDTNIATSVDKEW